MKGIHELIVRQATEADLDSIVKLGMELIEYHVKFREYYRVKENFEETTRKFHLENITAEKTMLLVAEVSSEIVGFTLGRIRKTPPIFQIEEYGLVIGLYVKEEYRRKRIGEKLTRELLKWFKSKGMKRVEVSVDLKNKIGVSAWTKFGFEPDRYRMKKTL